MIIRIAGIVALILTLSTSAYSDMGTIAQKYLDEVENKGASLFVSRCKLETNGYRYSAILIIEVGSSEGFLIEKRDNIVVNVATVSIDKAGPVLEETHGGVYSYERVHRLIDELVQFRFHLLGPLRMEDLQRTETDNICKYLDTDKIIIRINKNGDDSN